MKTRKLIVPIALVGLSLGLAAMSQEQKVQEQKASSGDGDADRILRGFQISPVHLTLRNRDRNLVGLGSYLVNAVGGCNDCHTNPSYLPGHDPFQGQPKQVNSAHYLAGGQHFGPFTSANITPDDHGLPAGLTLAEFKTVIRTGHDPDAPGQLLQVMPWPTYQNMTDNDLRAIYEYLRSIPHAEPGP